MLQAEQFQQKAVICFVICNGQILLIEKLRGLGMGKINGPGGKCEEGESCLAAAIRETQEEVLITPLSPVLRAVLGFRFSDGYSLYVEVYVAGSYNGEPGNSPEAIPFWADLDKIPYNRMWADDILWLPQILLGKNIQGIFDFDGDLLLKAQISLTPSSLAQ